MLPHARILSLFALVFLVFGASVNAYSQSGRLFGSVHYYDAYRRQYPAVGVRVILVGSYARTESRTDNNGNFGIVLPAGGYRVYGQGANGYSQRVEVVGYVRPGTDSYINPNPLVLVWNGWRSAQEMQENFPADYAAFSLLIDSRPLTTSFDAHRTGTDEKCNSTADMGSVSGRVVLRQGGKDEPAKQAKISAVGSHGQREIRADSDGVFDLRLCPGRWTLYITAGKRGFSSVKTSVNVIKGKHEQPILVILQPAP